MQRQLGYVNDVTQFAKVYQYKPQFKLPMKVTPSIPIYKLAHYTSKLFYKLTRWFSKGRLQALVGVSSCVVILYYVKLYVFFCLAWHTLPKSSK